MSNIALAIENHPGADPDDWFEIIEGVKTMAASARFEHNLIGLKLAVEFQQYADEYNIEIVYDVDVYLPDGNIFRPDLSVVCDSSVIGNDGKIHGVPELCVEVLSRSTLKNDIGIKKSLYARNGVKEYWIIDPKNKSVEIYSLKDSSFELDEVYISYTKKELEVLSANERAEVKDKIQVGIYPKILIDIDRIFSSRLN